MVSTSRTACALLAVAAVLMTSCTRIVDDARPVAGPDRSPIASASDGSQCEAVDSALTTIPALGDDEPVMKIPQPQGWDRMTMMDSELIRFAMANRSLASDGFASNVVVTLENAPGIEEPEVVFNTMRDALESDLGVTDLRVSEHTLCGLPAETIEYQTPIMGNIDPHPGVAVVAVLHTDDTTYAVSVTVQTKDPDDPDFQRDSEEILKGFQLLPPSAS